MGCRRSIIVKRIGSNPNLKYGSKQKLAAFTPLSMNRFVTSYVEVFDFHLAILVAVTSLQRQPVGELISNKNDLFNFINQKSFMKSLHNFTTILRDADLPSLLGLLSR